MNQQQEPVASVPPSLPADEPPAHGPVGTNLDDMIENKYKFGKFQYKTLSVVGLVQFVDGAESMFIVILVSILQKQWELVQFEVQSLASIFYWGLFFGAIVSGFAADILGRQQTLVVGSIFQTLLVLWTAFITTYIGMLTIRFFYGFVIGVTLPIGILLMTEQSPPSVRGRTTVVLQFFYTCGKLYMLLLAAIYLVSLSEGNWRMMALMMVIPCLAMVLGTIFILYDSIRYLLVNQPIQQAITVIDVMGRDNIGESYQNLTDEQIRNLKIWKESVFQENYTKMDRVMKLFQDENFGVTMRIWGIMIISIFMFSGLGILLPFLLDNDDTGGVFEFFLACIGEIPALILMFFIIDIQSLGRRKMFVIASSLLITFFLLTWWGKDAFLVLGLMIILFVAKLATLIFIPIMAEAYSSAERSVGIGIAASLGRIAGAIAPFFYYSLFLYDQWAPFLLNAFLSFLLLICTVTFPFDRTGKSMEPERKSERISKASKSEINKNLNDPSITILHKQEQETTLLKPNEEEINPEKLNVNLESSEDTGQKDSKQQTQ